MNSVIHLATQTAIAQKINGTSLVNPPRPVGASSLETVKRINAEWVAVIPYAFARPGETDIYFDTDRQWWGERTEGTKALIEMSQELGLKVMLKPHVWAMRSWIGDFDFEEEEDWQAWEVSYERYVLHYAKLAEKMEVPLYCIGTELKIMSVKRPDYWRHLIKKVRAVYDGKITYAANWDNYQNVTFWSELDYIGIDAYFPLVHNNEPSLDQMLQAWLLIKKQVERLSKHHARPILFTEFGYQSVKGAAGNHWEVIKSGDHISMSVQATAYESIFRSFWNEGWFAGGFLWKWHLRENAGGESDPNFTPQGKAAEEVIAAWYGNKP